MIYFILGTLVGFIICSMFVSYAIEHNSEGFRDEMRDSIATYDWHEAYEQSHAMEHTS